MDAELILAVDRSYSVNESERDVQRVGYLAALTDPRIIEAIKRGRHGRIAMAYVEWGDANDQQLVVPWRIVDSLESAAAFSQNLDAMPPRYSGATSISAALFYSAALFENNGFDGDRLIIDISGDGVNTSGPPVTKARDEIASKGITINGLPMPAGGPAPVPLGRYFRDCVIGGPGALIYTVDSWRSFDEALLRKMVAEISGVPERVWRASASKTDCLAGERKERDDYLKMLRQHTSEPERWMPPENVWPSPGE